MSNNCFNGDHLVLIAVTNVYKSNVTIFNKKGKKGTYLELKSPVPTKKTFFFKHADFYYETVII